MKTVKLITTDANGEITRELTILCDDNKAEAKLFHALLEKIIKLAETCPEVRVKVGPATVAQRFSALQDITNEDDVPIDEV